MRFYANFANNQWVEYDHARVIPRIKDSAQWDIVLDPQDSHRAVLAIRCSDLANKDIPISPKNPTPLSLCKVRTETNGLAVFVLVPSRIIEKYYAYAPLSSFLVRGNLELHRLRVRGTGHADLVLIGKGGGRFFLMCSALHKADLYRQIRPMLWCSKFRRPTDAVGIVFARLFSLVGDGRVREGGGLCVVERFDGYKVLVGVCERGGSL